MFHKYMMVTLFSLGLCTGSSVRSFTETKKYNRAWATHTSINLYRCAPNICRSQVEIERFVRNVCNYLGITRKGNTQFLYHYAGNGYTSGLSAIQQANGHTDITIRVDEYSNDIYIDFFSCVAYDPYELAHRAQEFFTALDMNYETIIR